MYFFCLCLFSYFLGQVDIPLINFFLLGVLIQSSGILPSVLNKTRPMNLFIIFFFLGTCTDFSLDGLPERCQSPDYLVVF